MRSLLCWLAVLLLPLGALHAAPRAVRYRFLIVVGDQWKDGTSFFIDRLADFQGVAALLKNWGLPFDILRIVLLVVEAQQRGVTSGRTFGPIS
ncbi:MAG: hypothetical protein Q8N18_15880 [Opitutaceae bacterium]|nr:hypothetical protein [Opitutaceae bacterium]